MEPSIVKRKSKSWFVRGAVAGSLVLMTGGTLFLVSSASASSGSKMGVITGTLRECLPDPAWGVISSTPAMVVVIHGGRTYESKSIIFPKKAPWSGVFRFSVPPGSYEVVSSYQGAAPMLTVKAGGKATASFGLIGCAR